MYCISVRNFAKAAAPLPEKYVTDRSQRFMASEIIREKLMRFTGEAALLWLKSSVLITGEGQRWFPHQCFDSC